VLKDVTCDSDSAAVLKDVTCDSDSAVLKDVTVTVLC